MQIAIPTKEQAMLNVLLSSSIRKAKNKLNKPNILIRPFKITMKIIPNKPIIQIGKNCLYEP